ncbi:hypothetical protein DPMN_064809 [Dreissena polymorpha]|uniref:Uncharacterized protein n=1 Tax=Dreissena polymorpha TaxID=45954 RepID=A0A9D4CE01_DREPO|nr:hypothetical protein DPMN_064809 [Dreissena polymorpha]
MHIEKYICPGLWEALNGLNIKNLKITFRTLKHEESFSQFLSSLTQLESLSIGLTDDSIVLWEALKGLHIRSVTLRGWQYRFRSAEIKRLNIGDTESLLQSLSTFNQLETLTIYLYTNIDIQLPQSLKYLSIYCYALDPSELRKLVHTLSAGILKDKSKLESGCVSFNFLRFGRIQLLECMAIHQELERLTNVAVKRFRILDRNVMNMQ